MPFLANDFFAYHRDADLGYFVHNRNIQIKSDVEILQDMGIQLDTNDFEENRIAEIKNAITKGHLVFVPIDRFHWNAEKNQDMYQKIHSSHFFLLTGYDDADCTFHVIDVTQSSTIYASISYEQLMTGYQGWLAWRGAAAPVMMARLYRTQNQISREEPREDHDQGSQYLTVFKHNFYLKRDELLDSFGRLLEASTYLREVGLDDTFFELPQKRFGLPIFFILQAKKVERYRIYKLFAASPKLFELQNAICNNWEIIRGVFTKMLITKRIEEKSVEKIMKKFAENHTLEVKGLHLVDAILHGEV